MITQLLRTFLAQALHTLVKSKPLKCNFLRLSSARVKIRQTPRVNFEIAIQFLFKFFIIVQCHYTLLCNSLPHAFTILDKNIQSKS